jgi:translation initiation factor 3 subunit B
VQSENGYKVWSSHGVLLTTVPLDSAYQVMWRPRPQSLITREREKEVLSTLREKYYKQFEAEDEKLLAINKKGAKAERMALK